MHSQRVHRNSASQYTHSAKGFAQEAFFPTKVFRGNICAGINHLRRRRQFDERRLKETRLMPGGRGKVLIHLLGTRLDTQGAEHIET